LDDILGTVFEEDGAAAYLEQLFQVAVEWDFVSVTPTAS
jgi:hypothetical protein